MFIIIDLIVLGFILSFVFYNYKKGLIKTATRILYFLISIALSLILFKPISYFIIYNTSFDDLINSYISNIVVSHVDEDNDIPVENYNLPKAINNYIDKGINSATTAVSETVSTQLTNLIINIVCFVIIFIITRSILFFVHFLSDSISKLPIVKQFDKAGGALYGLVQSLIILFIILTVISILPLFAIQNIINNTYLTSFLYESNPFLLIFYF